MIRLHNIKKVFHPGTVNENPVLNGLNLTIQEHDFVTIIGSNGAGKSTLMNVLAGSLTIDDGAILVDDTDITMKSVAERAHWIGRVFQDPMKGTAATLTIEENLALAMKRQGGHNLSPGVKNRYRELFKTELARLNLGLETRLDDPIGLLSGGQRQSITLLMATLVRPRFMLFDEHTAALDPTTARTVMKLTEELVRKQKLTAMMITHNLEHAVSYGNRIIMLHKGQVAFDLSGNERASETAQSLYERFAKIQ